MTTRRAFPLAVAAAIAALLQGCSYHLYERGSVKRTAAKKVVAPPADQAGTLGARVARDPGPGSDARPIRLSLVRSRQVDLARTREFNTIRWEAFYHPAAPAFEILELATAGLYAWLMPIVVAGGLAPPGAPHLEIPFMTKLKVATAPLNPFCSIMGISVRRTEVVEEVRFREAAVALKYAMHLPAERSEVAWRLLASDGRELAKGRGTTDLFGEVALGSPPAGAAAVEVSAAGLPPTRLELPK